jgi:hypothetical protein
VVFVVEFLDGLFFAGAGNADDLTAANSLSVADVRRVERSQVACALRRAESRATRVELRLT